SECLADGLDLLGRQLTILTASLEHLAPERIGDAGDWHLDAEPQEEIEQDRQHKQPRPRERQREPGGNGFVPPGDFARCLADISASLWRKSADHVNPIRSSSSSSNPR